MEIEEQLEELVDFGVIKKVSDKYTWFNLIVWDVIWRRRMFPVA